MNNKKEENIHIFIIFLIADTIQFRTLILNLSKDYEIHWLKN